MRSIPFVALLLVILTGGGFWAMRAISASHAQSVDPNCALPLVVAAMPKADYLDPAELAAHFPPPAREPAVYATVNGHPIVGALVEYTARITYANNQQTLTQPQTVAALSPEQQQALHETLDQLRQDVIQRSIDDWLLLLAAQQQGLVPSTADVQTAIQREVTAFNQASHSSPLWVQLQATLCANHLTIQAYAGDPRVVKSYTDVLAMQMLRYRQYADLSPTQQHDSTLVNQRVQAYLQQLRTTATIVIEYRTP